MELKKERARQTEREETVDRLSNLPEELLLHILSFMSTKHAVQTCVLSSRWKNLWKLVPTLTLNSTHFPILRSFSDFVSSVLLNRDDSAPLHSLDYYRLGFDSLNTQLLTSVISYAVSHKVRHLRIWAWIFELPHSIFSCMSLTSLMISGQNKTLVPGSLNLPALTSLHLQYVIFIADEKRFAEPFSSCIKLKILVIKSGKLCCANSKLLVSSAGTLCVANSTLLSLTICGNLPGYDHKIMLSTPNLRSLHFEGRTFNRLCGENLPFLEEICYDILPFSTICMGHAPIVISAMKQLSNAKSWTISSHTLLVLSAISVSILPTPFPWFSNLKSLKLVRSLYDDQPKPERILDYLRQNFPSVEITIINNCSCGK